MVNKMSSIGQNDVRTPLRTFVGDWRLLIQRRGSVLRVVESMVFCRVIWLMRRQFSAPVQSLRKLYRGKYESFASIHCGEIC